MTETSPKGLDLNPRLVGLIALGCLLGAGGSYLFLPHKPSLYAGFIRVGLLMSALWLALPSKNREAAWARLSPLGVAIWVATLLLVAISPKLGVPLLIVLMVIRFIRRPLRGSAAAKRKSSDENRPDDQRGSETAVRTGNS
ncbi:hypothetical protein [Stratiformator vulcanicus]|uniref:Uncharacterized protein n=1 Tax=Stratiformator vulcanicus TaxID=2527980 RepID=A0A517R4H6_9PLAN|nr:hypothetical protein [Stratiformator vulcanicus]QDT38771.1 hypothetical protein Pan189_31690 [Stratiformator vulcanicus]